MDRRMDGVGLNYYSVHKSGALADRWLLLLVFDKR